MDGDRRLEIEELFHDASELPADARPAFLDRHCVDPELRLEVESLLRFADTEGALLDRPTPGPDSDPVGTLQPGDTIGPYTIVEPLGEGGFGVVYRAEQTEPVSRAVALKVLKPGIDSRQVLERFASERQTLARMEHPNIARIFDAGSTPEGRPFFVMELVAGETITEYCERVGLELRERLRLMIPVCRALQHAHQKGVIHRDVKPSNVCVTERDGAAVPVVIDFGIAKLTSSTGGAARLTGAHQLVGTPMYMSPEQARFDQSEVDTRSDIYSVGVLLYELVTGQPPLDDGRIRSSTPEELHRLIRDVDAPRPSRRATPSSAQRLIRGDLDAVILKCLEKEPSRRFASMAELADEIERFVRHEPVLTGPPGRWHRSKQTLRRHRWIVATVSVVVISLVTGLAIALVGLREAREARREAERGEAAAIAVRDYLVKGLIAAASPASGGSPSTPVSEVVAEASARVADAFVDQPEHEIAVRKALSDTTRVLGQFAEAAQHAERIDALLREQGETSSDRFWLNRLRWARDLGRTGDRIRACEMARADVAVVLERAGGKETDLTAAVRASFGSLLWSASHYREAHDQLTLARSHYVATLGPTAERTVSVGLDLALCLRGLGEHTQATTLYRELLVHCLDGHGPDHPRTLRLQNNLAVALERAGEKEEAGALYEHVYEARTRVLGEDHPHTIAALGNVARARANRGAVEEAVELSEEARRRSEARLGVRHPETLRAERQVVEYLRKAGRWKETVARGEQLLEAQLESLEPDHPEMVYTLQPVALSHRDLGNPEAAIARLREMRDRARRKLGPFHKKSLDAEWYLEDVVQKRGDRDQHRELLRARYAHRREHLDHPRFTPRLLNSYAWSALTSPFEDLRDPTGPLEAARRAVRDEPDAARRSGYLDTLSLALERAGERNAAIDAQLRAVQLAPPEKPKATVSLVRRLAFLLADNGSRREAVLREAHARQAAALGEEHWLVAEIDALIGLCLSERGDHAGAERRLLRAAHLLEAAPLPELAREARERLDAFQAQRGKQAEPGDGR